jgi:predicted MFS family arabinose efflux permease
MSPPAPVLRIVLIGLAALALAMGVGRFAFTPMLPLMRDEGLLGVGSAGLLASCHFLGYLVGALCAARVPMAPRSMLRLSLVLIAVGTLGMGLSERYAVWLALRWVCGVASAWVLVLVSHYYVKALADRSRAELQGWIFSGVGAGTAIVGLGCLGIMLWHLRSAPAWLSLGLASLAGAVLLGLLMGEELPAERPAPRAPRPARSSLPWGLVLAYGIAGVGYTIPATYLPVMARASFDSPMVFGWSWPLFGAAAFVSTLLAAPFQARYSNRRIWAAGHGLMALGLLLPVVLPHIVTISIAGLCVGGSFMVVTMVGMREAHRIAAPPDVIHLIAVMTTAFAVGQIVGPLLASLAFTLSGGLSAALILASAMLLLAVLGLAPPSLEPRSHRA